MSAGKSGVLRHEFPGTATTRWRREMFDGLTGDHFTAVLAMHAETDRIRPLATVAPPAGAAPVANVQRGPVRVGEHVFPPAHACPAPTLLRREVAALVGMRPMTSFGCRHSDKS